MPRSKNANLENKVITSRHSEGFSAQWAVSLQIESAPEFVCNFLKQRLWEPLSNKDHLSNYSRRKTGINYSKFLRNTPFLSPISTYVTQNIGVCLNQNQKNKIKFCTKEYDETIWWQKLWILRLFSKLVIYCPPGTRYSIDLEQGVITEPGILPVLKELSIQRINKREHKQFT